MLMMLPTFMSAAAAIFSPIIFPIFSATSYCPRVIASRYSCSRYFWRSIADIVGFIGGPPSRRYSHARRSVASVSSAPCEPMSIPAIFIADSRDNRPLFNISCMRFHVSGRMTIDRPSISWTMSSVTGGVTVVGAVFALRLNRNLIVILLVRVSPVGPMRYVHGQGHDGLERLAEFHVNPEPLHVRRDVFPFDNTNNLIVDLQDHVPP